MSGPIVRWSLERLLGEGEASIKDFADSFNGERQRLSELNLNKERPLTINTTKER
jgi:hypothetical protein